MKVRVDYTITALVDVDDAFLPYEEWAETHSPSEHVPEKFDPLYALADKECDRILNILRSEHNHQDVIDDYISSIDTAKTGRALFEY